MSESHGRYLAGSPQRQRLWASEWWLPDLPAVFHLTVFDGTPEFVDTGLVFPDGRPVWRRLREPIGFLPFNQGDDA
jgi:hypothetical protein